METIKRFFMELDGERVAFFYDKGILYKCVRKERVLATKEECEVVSRMKPVVIELTEEEKRKAYDCFVREMILDDVSRGFEEEDAEMLYALPKEFFLDVRYFYQEKEADGLDNAFNEVVEMAAWTIKRFRQSNQVDFAKKIDFSSEVIVSKHSANVLLWLYDGELENLCIRSKLLEKTNRTFLDILESDAFMYAYINLGVRKNRLVISGELILSLANGDSQIFEFPLFEEERKCLLHEFLQGNDFGDCTTKEALLAFLQSEDAE